MKVKRDVVQERMVKDGRLTAKVGRVLQMREVSLAILLVIFGVCMTIATPNFLRVDNFRVLLQGMSTDMMIAIPCASP